MTEVAMPTQPECVGYAEAVGAEYREDLEKRDAAFRLAMHAALCVWADHPNRRFYIPSSLNIATSDAEPRDVVKIKVRYILEPMMSRIMAEQDQIKKDLVKRAGKA